MSGRITNEMILALQDSIDYFSNLLGVSTDILSGKPFNDACRDHDVDEQAFRKLIGNKKLGYKETRIDLDNLGQDKKWLLSWQENLWLAVFGETKIDQIPPHVDAAVNYVLHETNILTKKELTVLACRFQQGMTLEQTGKVCGVTQERVRQTEAKALRKLRWPKRANVLRFGLKYRELADELEAAHNSRKISVAIRKKKEEVEQAIANNDLEMAIRLRNDLNTYITQMGGESAKDYTETNIFDMDFSIRTYNSLHRGGIDTVSQLIQKSEKDLLHIRNFGRGCLVEVNKKLNAMGLHLRADED